MTDDELEALKAENPYDDEESGRAFAWEMGVVDGAGGHRMTKQDFHTTLERKAYLEGRVAGADAAGRSPAYPRSKYSRSNET